MWRPEHWQVLPRRQRLKVATPAIKDAQQYHPAYLEHNTACLCAEVHFNTTYDQRSYSNSGALQSSANRPRIPRGVLRGCLACTGDRKPQAAGYPLLLKDVCYARGPPRQYCSLGDAAQLCALVDVLFGPDTKPAARHAGLKRHQVAIPPDTPLLQPGAQLPAAQHARLTYPGARRRRSGQGGRRQAPTDRGHVPNPAGPACESTVELLDLSLAHAGGPALLLPPSEVPVIDLAGSCFWLSQCALTLSACKDDREAAHRQCSTRGHGARMACEPALQGALAPGNVRELFTRMPGEARAGPGSGAPPRAQSVLLPQPGGKRSAPGKQQQLGFPQKRLCIRGACPREQPQPRCAPVALPAVPLTATELCSTQSKGFTLPEPRAPGLVRTRCWQGTSCGGLHQSAPVPQPVGSSSAASSQSTHAPGTYVLSRSASSAPGLGAAASAARPLRAAAEALGAAPRLASTAWYSGGSGLLGQSNAGPAALGGLSAAAASGAAPRPAKAAWRSRGSGPPGQTGPGPPPTDAPGAGGTHGAAADPAAITGRGYASGPPGQTGPGPPAVVARPAARAHAAAQAAARAWPSTGSPPLLGQPGCGPMAARWPGAAEAQSADHGSGASARHGSASGVPVRVGPQLCQTRVPDAASQSPARPSPLQPQNKPRKSLRMTLAEWGLPYHIVQVLSG